MTKTPVRFAKILVPYGLLARGKHCQMDQRLKQLGQPKKGGEGWLSLAFLVSIAD